MKVIKPVAPEGQKPFMLGIVVSQWNIRVTQELLKGALKRLMDCGFAIDDITVVEVPGAVEIPIVIKKLAKSNKYQALIALGAVIRGETSHYDYVCEQVSQGCQRVSLDYDLPVIFGVLTTENEAQAWDRLGGNHGHKGIEAAECALAMQSVLQQIS
jgi:6,7-dimethyl-8-ribityllumazine synthase